MSCCRLERIGAAVTAPEASRGVVGAAAWRAVLVAPAARERARFMVVEDVNVSERESVWLGVCG